MSSLYLVLSIVALIQLDSSPPETSISALLDILQEVASPKANNALSKALILSLFKVIGQIKPSVLIDTEKSRNMSIIQCIRHLLVSRNPNDVYLFVSCLEEVDVSIWAGTVPDNPAVLEGLEFERILQLLDSADQGILRRVSNQPIFWLSI